VRQLLRHPPRPPGPSVVADNEGGEGADQVGRGHAVLAGRVGGCYGRPWGVRPVGPRQGGATAADGAIRAAEEKEAARGAGAQANEEGGGGRPLRGGGGGARLWAG